VKEINDTIIIGRVTYRVRVSASGAFSASERYASVVERRQASYGSPSDVGCKPRGQCLDLRSLHVLHGIRLYL